MVDSILPEDEYDGLPRVLAWSRAAQDLQWPQGLWLHWGRRRPHRFGHNFRFVHPYSLHFSFIKP